MSPFVYPPRLTDEQKVERRRLAGQARRIVAVKAFLLGAGVLLAIVAAGCGLLYLAVLVVRLAWGQS